MKRIFIAAVCSLMCISGMYARKAVMVAHYGSSEADTRVKTIGAITADIAAAFLDVEVCEAFISPIVRKRMIAAGYEALSPEECLRRLAKEGYDSVYVQSTTIIDGAEMRDVADACRDNVKLFKHLSVGRPLCFSPEDCLKVVEIMAAEPCGENETVVWCGHGNNLSSTATYCQLDYMLHAQGHDSHHVSTIEGYPTAASLISELQKAPGVKKVKLVPFLLVNGNHTHEEIDGDFAGKLHDAGYATETLFRGFGELPEVREIYVNRVAEMLGR